MEEWEEQAKTVRLGLWQWLGLPAEAAVRKRVEVE